jgi:hypothetical protein
VTSADCRAPEARWGEGTGNKKLQRGETHWIDRRQRTTPMPGWPPDHTGQLGLSCTHTRGPSRAPSTHPSPTDGSWPQSHSRGDGWHADCIARRREERKIVPGDHAVFPGTMQSETPVPPKVDFETRGPKTAESGRDIVSTAGAKNASLIRLGKEAIIRPRKNESRM